MALTLGELAAAAGLELEGVAAPLVNGIAHDSRRVRGGDVFVAIAGRRSDGLESVDEAVSRGAVAVCVNRRALGQARRGAVPLLVADDTRVALARLAAAFHGEPARSLRLVGITGTLGKTSTMILVQQALASSGIATGIGAVGSLGASVRGAAEARVAATLPDLDGMTTPDPPTLHRAFRILADAGVPLVVMEVTSHALAQERVHGLRFDLGVITNLVPDEHLEFHGTAENYLRTKARFLDHLKPDAAVVFDVDDPLVRRMIAASVACERRPLVGVSLAAASGALGGSAPDLLRHAGAVSVERLRLDAGGALFTLRVRREMPRLDGGVVGPLEIPIVLPVLGIQQVMNGALAATAALIAGASPEGVIHALADTAPVHRRMEVVHESRPLVIDDTAGNPETLRAVFASIRAIRRSGLRIVFGLRGSRGVEINSRLAAALADLVAARSREELVYLVVTWGEDSAGPRDRVSDAERGAALDTLSSDLAGFPQLTWESDPTVAGAVRRVLASAADDDLVLLLGTQGMDTAAEHALTYLARRGRRAADIRPHRTSSEPDISIW